MLKQKMAGNGEMPEALKPIIHSLSLMRKLRGRRSPMIDSAPDDFSMKNAVDNGGNTVTRWHTVSCTKFSSECKAVMTSSHSRIYIV